MAGRGAVTAFGDHCEWTGASADNREEWLISRRQGIGGSDVAAVLGMHRYKSALALYAEKLPDAPPDVASTEIARWGQLFEPQILKEFAGRTGRRVVRGGKLMRSKRAAHHLITLDGVQLTRPPPGCRGPGVAEVKTTGFTDRYDEASAGGNEASLPVDIRVQIQWEMWVTGATWATAIWLPFPERRLQWIDCRAMPDFQEALAEQVDAFWQRVLRREPPDPDGSESSLRALRQLYPGDNDELVRIAGDRALHLCDEYQRCRAAAEMLGERAAIIKNTFAATMRESKYALLDDGRYWRSALYPARSNACKHCGEELSHQASYRTYTFSDPRKKPFKQPVLETRELVGDLTADADDALERQLAASLVGSAPDNDPQADAVGAE
jgi:putative phage-type endonuclease